MSKGDKKLIDSIRVKLEAYAEKRQLNKIAALNEALDRALSVHRGEIALKTAYLVLDNFNQDLRTQEFLNKHKKAI